MYCFFIIDVNPCLEKLGAQRQPRVGAPHTSNSRDIK